jgi:serine/threonine protein kinase/tetratricopeptide (TPR) repeat protein
MIGKTISHYKILSKLGEGGMGVVYKAEDTKLDRFVALKFLPPHLGKTEEEKERFIHEAKAASAIEHTNICNIHEIDETDDGQLFIAMAHYEGETLKDKMKRGPLKLASAVDTAIQIVEGLARAHEEDIIHRDIKPANVIVTKRDVVKIVDFGLAKLAEGVKLTKTGTTLGTAAYMSPEQTSGKKVDRRSDIWSLGVVLYEMLTGRLPFMGEYEQAVSYAIVNEEPEPITALRTGVPIELERIVNKALAKKPDERYQHVDEMLVDLKNLRKEFEDSVATRKTKVAESHPRLSLKKIIIPIGAILVLLLAFFMLKSFLMEEVIGSAPIPVAVIPFENRTGDIEYDNLNIMIQDLLITKLSNSKYMYVSTRERLRDVIKLLDMTEEEVDSDSWFDVCRFDGVEAVVIGSVNKAGDTFVTDAKVLNVESKELIESASARGQGVSSILDSQIDELGKRISRIVGLSERKVEASEKSIREVTTSSIDAYNYFLRGREEIGKLRDEVARRFLEKAVELDSTFAMAYLWLGRAYGSLQDTKAENEAREKAMKYSHHASEKEKMYIEASYAVAIENDTEKSRRIYEKMAKRYPKEKRIYHFWGNTYSYSSDERIELHKKALEIDPNYGSMLNDLAYCYLRRGNFEEALVYLTKYASVSPGDPNPLDSMADVLYQMGRLDEAIAKYKEAIAVDPGWKSTMPLAYMYALKEKYSDAMKWIDQYITEHSAEGMKADGYTMKGLYYFLLGRLNHSQDAFKRAKDLYEEVSNEMNVNILDWSFSWIHFEQGKYGLSRTYMKRCWDYFIQSYPQVQYYTLWSNIDYGFVDLMEGRIDSAKVKLSVAKEILLKLEGSQRNIDYAHSRYGVFNGIVLLEENKNREAVSVLEKSDYLIIPNLWTPNQVRFVNLPFVKDALGRAYHQAGDLDKAIVEYERITRFNPDSKDRLLIHPKYHYRLAKLYEKKGMKDKAIERYEKFLDIWKDADEDLPEPHDARARLARLKQR